VQGAVQPVQPVQPVQGAVQPVQGPVRPVPAVQPVQGPVQPVQGAVLAVQGPVQPVQGPVPAAVVWSCPAAARSCPARSADRRRRSVYVSSWLLERGSLYLRRAPKSGTTSW
jgi:hypothetical protein